MLVPPYVDAVAGLMQKHIDAAMERCRSSLRIDASAGQRAGAPPPTTMDGPGVVGTPAGPAATAETA